MLVVTVTFAENSAEAVKNLSIEERMLAQEKMILKLEERILQLESTQIASVKPAHTQKKTPIISKPSAKAMVHQKCISPKETTQTLSKNEPLFKNTTPYISKPIETIKNLNDEELVSDEFPGSWSMLGTNTRIKIGGYIKTDLIIDLDGTLDKDQFLMSTIPVKGTPEYDNDGYISFTAKETRLNLDIRHNEPGSMELSAFFEGDFFSEGNQFRLRHAYLNVGDFLIGQTWTTLTFLESLPFMIDFAAGDALLGGRTTQVRYTHSITDQWKVAFGIEELSYLGIENYHDLPGKAQRKSPLIALRSDYRWDSGVLVLGTSVSQLHWDGEGSGSSDDAIQYNFLVAGRQNIGTENYFTWNISYGEGSGENIIAFVGSNANAVLNADGKLETIPALSVALGGGHEWNAKWSSNLAYAYGWLDTPDSRDPLALKRGGVGHINLIWKPLKQFSTGIEYMWGAQRVQNDALGKAERIQFMGKFDF